jgi:uncharacterized protein YdaU (DUF1376 family)
MRLYVGDLLGDTTQMSQAEFGAYVLILCAMWQAGGFIADERLLRRAARGKISDVVMSKLGHDERGFWQNRLLGEIDLAGKISLERSHFGTAGAKAKALKKQQRAQAKASENSKQKPKQTTSILDSRVYKEIESYDSISKANGHHATPFTHLNSVLDAEHATAVIDYRQRTLKAPLTSHAAKLLATNFGQCPDANAAADLMIERGWRGCKPEWVANAKTQDQQPRGQPKKQSPIMKACDDLFLEAINERTHHKPPN